MSNPLVEALKSCKYFIEELHERKIAINYNLLFQINEALALHDQGERDYTKGGYKQGRTFEAIKKLREISSPEAQQFWDNEAKEQERVKELEAENIKLKKELTLYRIVGGTNVKRTCACNGYCIGVADTPPSGGCDIS